MKYFILYLLFINFLGIITMYRDKLYAKRHQRRIKESTLFLIALTFGSLGIFLGMRIFRHKTKHWKFVIFIPIILLLQIVCIYWFLLP
ncbi:DUF1294 domain-containing protein [Clostridium thermarum]|uniref:DUF1294 domain-containing protein n=1 Tax=Clostridium thermarum TaxID=1716543 RepID=UPI00111D73DB|nr:DUF1294 domain-containing protein [Clostridium thermarum]